MVEVSNFFEPVGTFGILTQGGGHSYKMDVPRGGANHKMSEDEVPQNSDGNSSKAEALFNWMPCKMNIFKNIFLDIPSDGLKTM